MTLLLEREGELEALHAAAGEATRRGCVVVLTGEAGIGKTALVEAFTRGRERVLAGACEALNTPRPLGPFLDIAEQAGGELALLLDSDATPGAVSAALLRELRRRGPTVLVLEDLQWADEATLDLLRLLARRVAQVPALVLVTCRDELDRAHPTRVALGELHRLRRIALKPLSRDAVGTLAGPHGVDAAALHGRTAGNPFYVTEALAAGAALPDSVRDAVHARAARLSPHARELLDAVAIVPPRAELWLLDEGEGLDECIAAGMLRGERDAVAFRHEIARVAIEEALAPDRRAALHRRLLPRLAARSHDLARLAHHADAAGDEAAVLRYAPPAGERAAKLGAHREAAAQYARALRFATGDLRVELLERRSYECYLTDAIADAIAAREQALAEHEARGDPLGAGDAHRWLSRLHWFNGANGAAEEHATRAVELLEPLPPGRELAMAFSTMSQLRMLANEGAAAIEWGTRAIALAEALGERDVLAHALNNVGSARHHDGEPEGLALLERSLALALEGGFEEHVARAYTNLGWIRVEQREYGAGDRALQDGIAYCVEHDLDSWRLYMAGMLARSQLEQGRWDAAASTAGEVVEHPGVAPISRMTALAVLGRLRARRGDPGVWEALDEAHALAVATGEPQRLGPVSLARAEARWLAGELDRVAEEAQPCGLPWSDGELLVLRRRSGAPADALDELPEPLALELAGEADRAAAAWSALGCPYDAAVALLDSDDEAQLRGALDELRRLGARPAAARAARTLRERGARDLPSGPRVQTRANAAGLTARELEVLALLAAGLRNAEIAERLVLSSRTVAHHVSAILAKLAAGTRTEAVAEAVRLGLVER